MNDVFFEVFSWIKEDLRSNPLRFVVEVLAWILSISCSVTLALLMPYIAVVPWILFGCLGPDQTVDKK